MAERLRAESPLARRIAVAFLRFLDEVELEDADREGIDVARECLEQAFKLKRSSSDDQIQHGLLADLFKKYCTPHNEGQYTPTSNSAAILKSKDLHAEDESSDIGASRDELFGQFYAALDKNNYFSSTPDGDEDQAQLDKATKFFKEAIIDLEKSGAEKITVERLASSFKTLGNLAMQSNLYLRAVDLYTCAIALDKKNAIFHCNRAAAYTHLQRYEEAIDDCKKSIAVNPSYSKAYSRLGLVYYEQGEYLAAITAFQKAMQLDPNNASVNSNMEMARRRWEAQNTRAVRPEPIPGVGGTSWSIPLSDLPVTGIDVDEHGTHIVAGGSFTLHS